MDISKAVTQLSDFDGAGLIHVGRFNGALEALVERVPTTPGIYAFFKDIVLNTDTAESFYNDLNKEMLAKKFIDREGSINPLYHIVLKSKTEVSKTKSEQIRRLCDDELFRTSVAKALRMSLIFQAPLYVGKSNNLRSRIKQHFDDSSVLNQRLSAAGISIQQTSLVLMPLVHEVLVPQDDSRLIAEPNEAPNDFENEIEQEDSQSIIFEEIFSRLFSPLFTVRYG